MKKISAFLSVCLLFIYACNANNPRVVSQNDVSQVQQVETGKILDVQPVVIKGDDKNNVIGAVIGGLVGAVGANEASGKNMKGLITILGAGAGAVLGSVIPAKLGEHNGYQYTILKDGDSKAFSVAQGKLNDNDPGYKVGDKVIVIIGIDSVRVLPNTQSVTQPAAQPSTKTITKETVTEPARK
jgi:outer membrane lipoprotein SlyB